MQIALALLALAAPQAAETPLDSKISEVTVYGGSASVRRTAELTTATGTFVFAGLPGGLDPSSLRVRVSGAEVVSVETRTRLEANVPDARLAELRETLRRLERELQTLQDGAAVTASLTAHVERLLRIEEQGHAQELGEGRPDPEAWEKNFSWLSQKLIDLRERARGEGWAIEEQEREVQAARLELGRFENAGSAQLRDVVVELVDVDTPGAGALELEYVVPNAGWVPAYDLRATKSLDKVELVYRARVWQRSGEDWGDTAIVLSTAQPQRGTKGPEPRPVWLSLNDPRVSAGRKARAPLESLEALGYTGDAAAAPVAPESLYATVQDEGLSVRYRLAGPETILSRDEPTTVLVGRARLDVEPEHYCVPALDESVWLRAITKNTSPWVLLHGPASVYFGADYLGTAPVETVQREEQFTLHLGVDPGLTTRRSVLEDERESPGIFSSRATQREAYRIEIENKGAFTASADGSVAVIVQEVIPRSRDDRVEVSVDRAQPALEKSERWVKEREEKGLLTWIVPVPKGGKSTIELATEVLYPAKMTVYRTGR